MILEYHRPTKIEDVLSLLARTDPPTVLVGRRHCPGTVFYPTGGGGRSAIGGSQYDPTAGEYAPNRRDADITKPG